MTHQGSQGPRRNLLQSAIRQLGQDQDGRVPAELRADFIQLDERRGEDIMAFVRRFSAQVQFFAPEDRDPGTWEQFFDRLHEDGSTEPAVALLAGFLQAREQTREVFNRFTARHLSFFYEQTLRFVRRCPIPDRAHLVVSLKKGAQTIELTSDARFSAGKDPNGAEMLFAPTERAFVGPGTVGALSGIFVDGETLRCAAVADSADGVGSPLPEEDESWPALGSVDWPRAEIGFAVVSPDLRLAEGNRTVTLTVKFADSSAKPSENLESAFVGYLSGESHWLGPFTIEGKPSDLTWCFELIVPADSEAISDHDPAIHGDRYPEGPPVLQMLTAEHADYASLQGLQVESVQVQVEVSGIQSLSVESDQGVLDPKKAFLPFGAEPRNGGRFMVSYPEALNKDLNSIEVEIDWQDLPNSLKTHYESYQKGISDDSFTVHASLTDGHGDRWSKRGIRLFQRSGLAWSATTISLGAGGSSSSIGAASSTRSSGMVQFRALHRTGGTWAGILATRMRVGSPVIWQLTRAVTPKGRDGFLTLTLERDFLHQEYRRLFFTAARDQTLSIPNEPYLPTALGIRLSYTAQGPVCRVSSTDLADLACDTRFYHVDCFGSRLEHAAARARVVHSATTTVPLIPEHTGGSLLIGLDDLPPGDALQLLVRVSQGSADPDAVPARLQWSILADEHWLSLEDQTPVTDGTWDLLTHGIVKVTVPTAASTEHCSLSSGRLWLRAHSTTPLSHSRLVKILANGLEVELLDRGNDSTRFGTPLPAQSIAKVRSAPALVKEVEQPYASFGGAPEETGQALYRRAAEHLRHRSRSKSTWDYERMILAKFPDIQRVKCVPHATDRDWESPGHVLVVPIPDLRGQNVRNPLEPKLDSARLREVEACLADHVGSWITVRARNPHYQRVRLSCRVKLHSGEPFNLRAAELNEALLHFLSPWAYDAERPPTFGGVVPKSVLVHHLEQQAAVDYITDVRLQTALPPRSPQSETRFDDRDLDVVHAQFPDVILVSVDAHQFDEIREGTAS